jgi:hypothetical protein
MLRQRSALLEFIKVWKKHILEVIGEKIRLHKTVAPRPSDETCPEESPEVNLLIDIMSFGQRG